MLRTRESEDAPEEVYVSIIGMDLEVFAEESYVPFERFFVGGDGLANFALDGREIIQLRGYPNNSLSSIDGGTVYNKFSVELRYPITMNQSASIYALTFLEAGAAFNEFKDYNPFRLRLSAGVGLRFFLPMFGLLGFDYGIGIDRYNQNSGIKVAAKFTFMLGQEAE